MNARQKLLGRLEEIGANLKQSGRGLGLLGLGSVGLELDRLDEWSDLDFFAIVAKGAKQDFICDTGWMNTESAKVSYLFRNTSDGYKLLWDDGVFAEMAVFEPAELDSIPYAPGRIVWAAEGTDATWAVPKQRGQPPYQPETAAYAAGELLTCLYVGMCRFRRGEKLSAWRFIQNYCLDRFLEITALTETSQPGVFQDFYSRDRRWEQLYPGQQAWLSRFLTGIEGTPEAVLAYLDYLEKKGFSHPAMAGAIRKLCPP